MPNAYPLVFTVGAMASLLWLAFAKPSRGNSSSSFAPIVRFDAGLSALAGGLVGARAAFVALHADYFASRLVEALWVWEGGLSWVGGALGAVLGLALYCALARRPFWPLADALACPATLMALTAWSACLLDGCAYGRRAEASWLAPLTQDIFGGVAYRWPTQAAGAVSSIGAFAGLQRLSGLSQNPGVLASLSVALIAVAALALSFTRGDPVASVSGLRLDAVTSAGILLVAVLALAARSRRR